MTEYASVARTIARELGDDFDNAHTDKREWTQTHGQKAGWFRDVNAPTQADYLQAARAVRPAPSELPGVEEIAPLVAAAEEFVRRVEVGEIRSVKTYAAFKDALSRLTKTKEPT